MLKSLLDQAHKYHMNFTGTQASVILWSLTRLNFPYSKHVFYSLSRNAIRDYRDMSFRSLSNMLFAYAKAGKDYQNPALYGKILKRINTSAPCVPSDDLVTGELYYHMRVTN